MQIIYEYYGRTSIWILLNSYNGELGWDAVDILWQLVSVLSRHGAIQRWQVPSIFGDPVSMGLRLMLAVQSLHPPLPSSNICITNPVLLMLKYWTEKRFSLLKGVSHSGPMFSHLQIKQVRFMRLGCIVDTFWQKMVLLWWSPVILLFLYLLYIFSPTFNYFAKFTYLYLSYIFLR